MAYSHSCQWHSLHQARHTSGVTTCISASSVARLLCSSTRATNSKQHSTSSSTSFSAPSVSDQHLVPPEDASPICVFLPNGRQFQIQVVVRRGGPPEWSFAGMDGLPPPSATGVVQSSSSGGGGTELAGQLDSATASEADMLPWELSEEQQQRRQQEESAAMQAAARSLAALFNQPADYPEAAAAAGLKTEELPWSLSEQDAAAAAATEDEELPWSEDECTAAAAAATPALQPDVQQQQQSLQFADLHQQLLHYQLQQEQHLPPASPKQQQQQQGRQWWQQAQTPEILLQRIAAAVHPWQVSQVVTSYYDKFTADVTSAALTRLDALAPFKLIKVLTDKGPAPEGQPASRKGKNINDKRNNSNDMLFDTQLARQSRSQQRQTAVALYQSIMGLDTDWQPLSQQQQQHDDSSSSSSARDEQQQRQRRKEAWQGPLHDSIQDPAGSNPSAAAAAARSSSSSSSSSSSHNTHTHRLNEHLKPLVRGYLRCMQLLVTQGPEVTAAALVSAARLAARLVGPQCAVHAWWAGAHGYAVLGEAALRFKDGGLSIRDAVEIAYSYQHCGYTPTVLLQEVLQRLKTQPAVLDVLSVREVCHMTYCITSNPNLQYSPKTLTTAVLQQLQNPTAVASARPYDVVMVLRHMCQLNPSPPEGIEQGLLLAVISKMPQMSMQELSTVLHIAVEWGLQWKLQLAEVVAGLVAAAAGLPLQQQQQQQSLSPGLQRQQQNACLSDLFSVSVDRQQQQLEVVPLQQQQGCKLAAGTAAAAVTADLLQHLQAVKQYIIQCCKASHNTQQQQHSATAAAAVPMGSVHSFLQQQQQQQQQRQLPLTAADPVFLLHRFCQCGYTIPKPLLHHLLRAVGPRLHHISLLQAGLLTRALVMQWEDPQGCYEVLTAALSPWMVPGPSVTALATTSYASTGAGMSTPGTTSYTSTEQGGTSGDTARQWSVSSRVLSLPYWQLKGLIIAAGRLGPLAGDMAAAAAAAGGAGTAVTSSPRWVRNSSRLLEYTQTMQEYTQPMQQQQYRQAGPDSVTEGSVNVACSSSSSSSSSRSAIQQQQDRAGCDGGREAAVAFVSGLMDLLEQPARSSSSTSAGQSSSISQSSSPNILEWRADMVLALFWAAARLGLTPGPQVLQDGTAALAARMHRQVSNHESVNMVWAAATLGIKDPAFLQQLCNFLCRYAYRLHPKSIATAAWALAQLRCPQTAVLAALSESLLSNEEVATSHQQTRQRCWGRKQQQQPLTSSSGSSRQFLHGSYYFRNKAKPVPTSQGWEAIEDSSSRSSVEYHPEGGELLAKHPRVALLGGTHLAQLACSCVKAGWAPPQLLLVLAVRAVQLMHTLQPADLAQLLWAFSAANCRVPHLAHAAAARAAALAEQRAFGSSKQAMVLLLSLRGLGLSDSEARIGLAAEVQRLQRMEVEQQQQQQQQR